MTDNIDRIQEKVIPTTLLATDILRLKDSIDALSALTKAIGETTCLNSEGLKEIIEVLTANKIFVAESSELDLAGQFDVWCDVTRHLQRRLTRQQENIMVDTQYQRELWDSQEQFNEGITTFMDKEFGIIHKELDNLKSLVEVCMNSMAINSKIQIELLRNLDDAINRGDVSTSIRLELNQDD